MQPEDRTVMNLHTALREVSNPKCLYFLTHDVLLSQGQQEYRNEDIQQIQMWVEEGVVTARQGRQHRQSLQAQSELKKYTRMLALARALLQRLDIRLSRLGPGTAGYNNALQRRDDCNILRLRVEGLILTDQITFWYLNKGLDPQGSPPWPQGQLSVIRKDWPDEAEECCRGGNLFDLYGDELRQAVGNDNIFTSFAETAAEIIQLPAEVFCALKASNMRDDKVVTRVKHAVLSRVLYGVLLLGLGDAHDVGTLEKTQEEVEEYCRVSGLPTGQGLLVLVHWLIDNCTHWHHTGYIFRYIDTTLSHPLVHAHLSTSSPDALHYFLSTLLIRRGWSTVCQVFTTLRPKLRPKDAVLWVMALLSGELWQEAFVLQRELVKDIPPGSDKRYLPLHCLVHSLIQLKEFRYLLCLPYSKQEEHEVVAYLWSQGHEQILVLLLLKRQHFRRALALKQYLKNKPSRLDEDEVKLVEGYAALSEVEPSEIADMFKDMSDEELLLVADLEGRPESAATPMEQEEVRRPPAGTRRRSPGPSMYWRSEEEEEEYFNQSPLKSPTAIEGGRVGRYGGGGGRGLGQPSSGGGLGRPRGFVGGSNGLQSRAGSLRRSPPLRPGDSARFDQVRPYRGGYGSSGSRHEGPN